MKCASFVFFFCVKCRDPSGLGNAPCLYALWAGQSCLVSLRLPKLSVCTSLCLWVRIVPVYAWYGGLSAHVCKYTYLCMRSTIITSIVNLYVISTIMSVCVALPNVVWVICYSGRYSMHACFVLFPWMSPWWTCLSVALFSHCSVAMFIMAHCYGPNTTQQWMTLYQCWGSSSVNIDYQATNYFTLAEVKLHQVHLKN